jgi:hypothetical protein
MKRISIILSAGGLVLDLLGLFLPWAEWSWTQGYVEWSPMRGISIPFMNMLSLSGWLIAVLSLVIFKVTKQKFLLVLTMVGGIMIMACSFAGIVKPGTFFGLPLSSLVHRVSYGVYVSLVGGALTFFDPIEVGS